MVRMIGEQRTGGQGEIKSDDRNDYVPAASKVGQAKCNIYASCENTMVSSRYGDDMYRCTCMFQSLCHKTIGVN